MLEYLQKKMATQWKHIYQYKQELTVIASSIQWSLYETNQMAI